MPDPRRALLVLLAVLVAACAPPPDPAGAPTSADADVEGADVRGEVLVQAAASLTDAFAEVAAAFEAVHPGVRVSLNLAGSQSLAAQILQGAPADVFASADDRQMQVVADAGLLAADPRTFARTAPAIVVEAGNPLGVRGLADLADPDVVLVLAAPEVPAGALAARALAVAGVTVAPASLELDVRSVLAKVRAGEADAGIVYAADLVSAGDAVDGVAIPEAPELVATYPIAALADAPNPAAAAAFTAFVLGPRGQAVMVDHGFRRG